MFYEEFFELYLFQSVFGISFYRDLRVDEIAQWAAVVELWFPPFGPSIIGGGVFITFSSWSQLAEAQETMLSLLIPSALMTPASAEAPSQTIVAMSYIWFTYHFMYYFICFFCLLTHFLISFLVNKAS